MSEPLLCIRNHHALASGDPPIVRGDDPNLYIGYFENVHGEQWIFAFDRQLGKGELRGGDVGWNEVFDVSDGTVPGLVLSDAEAQWLRACWHAVTGGR